MQHKIFEIDPRLARFESDFDLRMDNYRNKKAQLLQDGKTLSAFANGYLYFGFHQTPEGWFYREWAPAAEGMFLTGDFNIPTDNEAFAALEGELSDARKTSPESDQRATYNAWGGREATIDHIFYRKATPYIFKVLSTERYGVPYISDHYPVSLIATIK